MHGYRDCILWVDLSTGKLRREPLDPAYARDYIGAGGLAARYLYQMLLEKDDPFSPLGPDNPLIWMTGMLTGTRTPSSSRSVFCARSPLTGIWGEANVGGMIGAALRSAGYDGVIITGRSSHPVYLMIEGDSVALRDASSLWGKDTEETHQEITSQAGSRVRVACIGIAGENMVRFASIMTHPGRAAGRTGMGAVMGSKLLKAIAVRHESGGPELADPTGFRKASERALAHVQQDFAAALLKEMGTASGTQYFDILGSVPSRYWTLGAYEHTEKLSGPALVETIQVGSTGCWGCWVQCGTLVEIPDDKQVAQQVPGPEYETMLSLGTQLMVGELETVSYLGQLCDLYGMDSISAGAVVGFAMYLYDAGTIDAYEVGGIDLEWGAADQVARLLGMIARRDGFGDVLADGSLAMEARYDAPGLAVQVNGLEPAMHDPRGVPAMTAVYLSSPRGACHNKSDFYMVASGHMFPEIGVEGTEFGTSKDITAPVVRHQDWRTMVDSTGCCLFVNVPVNDLVQMIRSAAGWGMDLEDLCLVGERIVNLKRLINLRLGLEPSREVLPKLLKTPLKEGGTSGFVPDDRSIMAEYYELRGWDRQSGRPFPHTLEKLGLDAIA